MELKVMTYNICSGRDFTNGLPADPASFTMDVRIAGRVMQKYGADIIGVNEVRGHGADRSFTEQAQTLGEQLGYRYFFGPAISFDGVNPYGNALLTRFPILRAEVVPIPDPAIRDEDAYYETRAILRAELDVPGGLTVLVSHFGLANGEKRNAVATLLSVLDETKGPVIFMGDLNMQPHDPILQPVFARLHDTASILPAPPMTFASYKPEIKIDYIFTSSHLRTLDACSPDETASDHKPYLARLEF